jgi:hypothetical protein
LKKYEENHEERKHRLRLEMKDSFLKRLAIEEGGNATGRNCVWLVRPIVSVPILSMYKLSSAQLQSVHAPTSAQLDGSYITDCTIPVLLKPTPVQRSETDAAPLSVE